MFERLCAVNSTDKARIRDFLHTVPADSVLASKLSVTFRDVNLDMCASASLVMPDGVLSVRFVLSSSGDAVAAPPTTIGASQANVNNTVRSSGANAHFACLAFVPRVGLKKFASVPWQFQSARVDWF